MEQYSIIDTTKGHLRLFRPFKRFLPITFDPIGRYVPGSQPSFSLDPDPNQNKEVTPFIAVVAYRFYIPLSRLTQLYPSPHQTFEKNAKDPARISEVLIQDPKGFLPNFMGFK